MRPAGVRSGVLNTPCCSANDTHTHTHTRITRRLVPVRREGGRPWRAGRLPPSCPRGRGVAVAAVVVVRFGLPPPNIACKRQRIGSDETAGPQGMHGTRYKRRKPCIGTCVHTPTAGFVSAGLQASTRKHAHTTHCCPLAPWLAYRARPFERGDNSAGGPLFTVDGGARGENGTVG